MYSSGCRHCGGFKEICFSYEYLCKCDHGKRRSVPLTEEDVKRIIKESKENK